MTYIKSKVTKSIFKEIRNICIFHAEKKVKMSEYENVRVGKLVLKGEKLK